MLLLFTSLVALLAGPVLFHFLSQQKWLLGFFDAVLYLFIFVAVFLVILPEVVVNTGKMCVLIFLAGIFIPTLAEKAIHYKAHKIHSFVLILGIVGLAIHIVTDGMALIEPFNHHTMLPATVILHRIPVGFAIWWLIRPTFGLTVSIVIFALMVGFTLAGYYIGEHFVHLVSLDIINYFQAFVAGSILHIVFHRKHKLACDLSSEKKTLIA